MSAEINFTCNFCRTKILSNQPKSSQAQGFCIPITCGSPDSATTNLEANLYGPHICQKCLLKLLARFEDGLN